MLLTQTEAMKELVDMRKLFSVRMSDAQKAFDAGMIKSETRDFVLTYCERKCAVIDVAFEAVATLDKRSRSRIFERFKSRMFKP